PLSFSTLSPPALPPVFPYTTLFRSAQGRVLPRGDAGHGRHLAVLLRLGVLDRGLSETDAGRLPCGRFHPHRRDHRIPRPAHARAHPVDRAPDPLPQPDQPRDLRRRGRGPRAGHRGLFHRRCRGRRSRARGRARERTRIRRRPGMIVTRAPGKLFIAGEYAVVSPTEPAVLVAVDRCITVRLTESEDAGRIHSSEYGRAPLVWRREQGGEAIVLEHRPADYVLSAISTLEELRAARGVAPRYFDLDISSELDDADGRKFGLGSSAAVTVATVAALDEFYALGLSATERFKLALLATIAIAPNASGGDLAASTF